MLDNLNEEEIYKELGEEGFTAMVAAFYRRVRTDDLLGPMYPEDDWEGSEERLRDFLLFRFGGVPRYIENRGHPRLRRRHFPFTIDSAARDRWVSLMRGAMDEIDVPDPHYQALLGFFAHVANFMRNQPEDNT